MAFFISGFLLSFGKDLVPSIKGYTAKKEDDKWIFCEKGSRLICLITAFLNILFTEKVNDNLSDDDADQLLQKDVQDSLQQDQPINMNIITVDSPSVSSNVSSPCTPSSPPAGPLRLPPSTPVSRPKCALTVHQDQDWLKKLKANFKVEIIDPCSAKANRAVENDEYIEVLILKNKQGLGNLNIYKDDREFLKIRNEILNSLMTKLKEIFAGDRPGKRVMEQLTIQLSYIYPNMFRECEGVYVLTPRLKGCLDSRVK